MIYLTVESATLWKAGLKVAALQVCFYLPHVNHGVVLAMVRWTLHGVPWETQSISGVCHSPRPLTFWKYRKGVIHSSGVWKSSNCVCVIMSVCFWRIRVCLFAWCLPDMIALSKFPSSVSNCFDFCSFGIRWRKKTRIQIWSCGQSEKLSRKCQSRAGAWSFCNKREIILQGYDQVSKRLWTQISAPYPDKLCKAIALILHW